MRESIHRKRLTRSRRARLLAAATLIGGVLVAGCGGGSGSRPPRRTASHGDDHLQVDRGARRRRDQLRLDRAGAGAPGRSRSRSACAPTACPTSRTRSPGGGFLFNAGPSTRQRPRSGRRGRSV